MDVADTPVGIGDEKEGARGVGSPAEAPDGAQWPADADVLVQVDLDPLCGSGGKAVVEGRKPGSSFRAGPEG